MKAAWIDEAEVLRIWLGSQNLVGHSVRIESQEPTNWKEKGLDWSDCGLFGSSQTVWEVGNKSSGFFRAMKCLLVSGSKLRLLKNVKMKMRVSACLVAREGVSAAVLVLVTVWPRTLDNHDVPEIVFFFWKTYTYLEHIYSGNGHACTPPFLHFVEELDRLACLLACLPVVGNSRFE